MQLKKAINGLLSNIPEQTPQNQKSVGPRQNVVNKVKCYKKCPNRKNEIDKKMNELLSNSRTEQSGVNINKARQRAVKQKSSDAQEFAKQQRKEMKKISVRSFKSIRTLQTSNRFFQRFSRVGNEQRQQSERT